MAGLEGGPIIDALTGTYNRHHFDCCLTRELDRARRYWLPLSIIMLDIDLFKRVNAAYGRQAGDQVLAHLGRLIFQLVRNTDVVARYEGDVFVVITPHTRLPDAQELAERLRLKVETTPVALPDAQAGSLNISVSIGVAALFDDVTDAEGLLRLAGDALYMAKKCGRDQVVVCDRSMVHAQLN
jgi:diguanylate cyclase (GGDEF)-like protein